MLTQLLMALSPVGYLTSLVTVGGSLAKCAGKKLVLGRTRVVAMKADTRTQGSVATAVAVRKLVPFDFVRKILESRRK